ncbi:porin family protein [Aquisalimonas lutea]|uniref:porin family protein n=1 Tax=Aquisalimonas lutea TaxID=1327750 RepID=UPI0025B601B9|nr:porin family protein [Aquisalimonas lutea]MDN3516276.1 porin family protein [Aquisalimonas lutea]
MQHGNLSVFVITTTLLAAPALTLADTGTDASGYVGAQAAFAEYDPDNVSGTADLTALVGRAGFRASRYFSMEARLGTGLGDDSVDVFVPGAGNVAVDVDIDYLFGAYGRGHIPLSDRFSLYGVAGFTSGELTFDAAGYSDSESDSGLSYGVGADFHATDHVGLNVEYMQYLDESNYEISALSVGVVGSF